MSRHDSRYHFHELHWNIPPTRREALSAIRGLRSALYETRHDYPVLSHAETQRLQRQGLENLSRVQEQTRAIVAVECERAMEQVRARGYYLAPRD